jgi:hypothetical protein
MGNAATGMVTEQVVGGQVDELTKGLGLDEEEAPKKEKKSVREERLEREKLEAERAERQKAADERHAKSRAKADELRTKYGLDKREKPPQEEPKKTKK